MLKIMKSIWIGLFVTLLLVGHVQASEGGGGAGGTMINPYQGPWGEMFIDFDGPSENLEQALYKVKYDGKYLTERQRTRFYNALNNNPDYDVIVAAMGHDAALEQMVIRSSPEGSSSTIKSNAKSLRSMLQSLESW